jgi:hypothetical protein
MIMMMMVVVIVMVMMIMDDDNTGVCRTESTYLCIVFYFVQLPELGLFIEVVRG